MSNITTNRILNLILEACGVPSMTSPLVLHEPFFDDTKAELYLQECIRSGWVSTNGEWVTKFEKTISSFTGAKHAVAVCNGTNALRLALHTVGVTPQSEVIMPAVSFVATANAASHLGAVPHFVDIDADNLGLCPTSLNQRLKDIAIKQGSKVINRETGREISAVVAVHIFGEPAKVKEIADVAKEWDLPLVEDAAEALGSWVGEREAHCGLIGDIGIFSFNGNKLITTGGGGMIITNDEQLAYKAKHLSTTAKVSHPWLFNHDEIGWNDRMPNINAALGVAQMEVIEDRIKAKKILLENYKRIFKEALVEEVSIVDFSNHSNHWLISLKFTSHERAKAHKLASSLLEEAHSQFVYLRPLWTPLHKLNMYKNSPAGDLSITEDECQRYVNLPSSPQLLNQKSEI